MSVSLEDVLAAIRELHAPPQPLLDARQAGELLNGPASWLLSQARKDKIPHCKLGHYTRFERDQLLEWVRDSGRR